MPLVEASSPPVGRTPLICLNALAPGEPISLYGKAEFYNPTGSVKDRAAISMVRGAERRGLLHPGGTIVEATSGNLGIALASIGARCGYRVVLVVPDSVSPNKLRHMRAFGAETILTPAIFGMKRAFAEARRLSLEIPGAFVPDQPCNPDNPAIHYATTGPEIFQDTQGRIDAFVAGVGSGGTLSGVAAYLREQRPEIEIVAVEPAGSPMISRGTSGPHRIEGIGPGFIPQILRRNLIDRVQVVSDIEAEQMVLVLARRLGVLVGLSSGATVCAALKVAREEQFAGKTVVTVLADSGTRYLSNAGFMDQQSNEPALPLQSV
jgi:cysteine synthase A